MALRRHGRGNVLGPGSSNLGQSRRRILYRAANASPGMFPADADTNSNRLTVFGQFFNFSGAGFVYSYPGKVITTKTVQEAMSKMKKPGGKPLSFCLVCEHQTMPPRRFTSRDLNERLGQS